MLFKKKLFFIYFLQPENVWFLKLFFQILNKSTACRSISSAVISTSTSTSLILKTPALCACSHGIAKASLSSGCAKVYIFTLGKSLFLREAQVGGGAKFSPAALKFTLKNRLNTSKFSPAALVFALEIREDHPFQSIQTSSESPRSGQNP